MSTHMHSQNLDETTAMDGLDIPMSYTLCCWKGRVNGECGMLLRLKQQHAEGASSFVACNDDANGSHHGLEHNKDFYAVCPVDGCGELVVLGDMSYHLELHAEEIDHVTASTTEEHYTADDSNSHQQTDGHGNTPATDTAASLAYKQRPSDTTRQFECQREQRNRDRISRGKQKSRMWKKIFTLDSWKRIFPLKMPTPIKASPVDSPRGKRQGEAQLGKFAHEEQMPQWLVEHLKRGGQVVSEGIIPVISQLLEQSVSTEYAYLCHPCVKHVSKLKREGGFCGYRNIQMLASYINGVKCQGYEFFGGKTPSIFKIQEFIELAWDAGINPHGRVETGGIQGTRKYIGTPEAQALLRFLDVPCTAQGYRYAEPGKAEALLYEDVERYFEAGVSDPTAKIRRTSLPPIYFQHAGHSMTIVGAEKQTTGTRNLLVFDPLFRDSPATRRLVGKNFTHYFPSAALKAYRRGSKYLHKYREFEVLRLDYVPAPMWD